MAGVLSYFKGSAMGMMGLILLGLLAWLHQDGWFEPKHSQGFRISVTIDYQGREIELARNVECVWEGGGASGAGSGGGGGYRTVAYHNFGQIMPDGALVMAMVPNLCGYINKQPPRHRGPQTIQQDSPSWGELPPKTDEMPLLFWAAKSEGFDEVIGFWAPEAYAGPYAKFQIKRWDVTPINWSRPRDFDPPDNYAAMGLVGPSDDRHKFRWNGKHSTPGDLPIPLTMTQEKVTAYPPGFTLPFDPEHDSVAPWDPQMVFYNMYYNTNDRRNQSHAKIVEYQSGTLSRYGVSTKSNSLYRRTYGLCKIDGFWRHGADTLGVSCFYIPPRDYRFFTEQTILHGISKAKLIEVWPKPPPYRAKDQPNVRTLLNGTLYGYGRFTEAWTGY